MSRPTHQWILVGCILLACGVAFAASGLAADTETPANTTDSTQAVETANGEPATTPQDTTPLVTDFFEAPNDTVSEPQLDLFVAEPVVEAGTETTVEIAILNTASIETGTSLDEPTATARGVRVVFDDDDAPLTVNSGETTAGSIPPGEVATVPVSVTVPESADGDSGELAVDVEYTYTAFDNDGNATDETETESFDVELEVGGQSQFEIGDVETDAQVGTDGTVEVDLENVGSDDAEAVRVTAQSPTGGVTAGPANGATATGPQPEEPPESDDQPPESDDQPPDDTETTASSGTTEASSAAFVGDIESDETATVAFDTRIDSDVNVDSYLLELQVVYEDEDGILRESPTLATAVEPTAGQTFEISNLNSTLEVGERGTVTATLENTGPEDVETPVVRAETASERIDITDSSVAVDDLEDGETAEISFDAEVSSQADAGDRQLTLTVEYGIDRERLESDPFVERIDVADERRAFSITAEDAEIPAGTTQTVELNVTNNRNERLSNLNVFLYPDDPLSVDADEAFIDELEPGDSETVAVDVSVDETASQRAYPLDLDIRYDDETDDDRISQRYQIPVTVEEPPPDDGLFPSLLPVAGVVALLVGATAAIRWRQ